jgi:hypothetical protein
MSPVALSVSLIATALLAIEVLLVARRSRTAARLAEPVWFMVFLGSLGLLALAAASLRSGIFLLPVTALMLWSSGAYLDQRDGRASSWWWHLVGLLFVASAVLWEAVRRRGATPDGRHSRGQHRRSCGLSDAPAVRAAALG